MNGKNCPAPVRHSVDTPSWLCYPVRAGQPAGREKYAALTFREGVRRMTEYEIISLVLTAIELIVLLITAIKK